MSGGRFPMVLALRAVAWTAVVVIVLLPIVALLLTGVPALAAHLGEFLGQRVWGLFLRTILAATAATALAMAIGVPAALVVEAWPVAEGLRRWIRGLAFVSILLPPYYQVAVWRPLVQRWLAAGEPARLGVAAALLGLAHAPLILYFVSHGIRRVARETIESSLLDTPSRLRVVWHVLLPLCRPSLAAGAALVLVMTLLDHAVPSLLLVNVYAMEVLAEYQLQADLGAAMVFALPLLVVAVGGILLLDILLGRVDGGAPAQVSRRSLFVGPGRVGGFGVAIGVVIVLMLLVALPLGRLVLLARSDGLLGVLGSVLRTHGRELVAGAWVTLAATGLAVGLAACIVPRSGRPGPVVRALVWLPLAVPGPLLGAALIRIYNRPVLDSIYGSSWILVVAGVARFFPIAYHSLAAHLRTVPREYWEAADLSSRGSPWKVRHVFLPLAAPGLVLAASAFILLQSAELSAAVLVAPPGSPPVSLTVSSLLHYNTELGVPAMLCLAQFTVVLAMIGCLQAAGRGRWGRVSRSW